MIFRPSMGKSRVIINGSVLSYELDCFSLTYILKEVNSEFQTEHKQTIFLPDKAVYGNF